MSDVLYPWLRDGWQSYWQRYHSASLAHATLIVGSEGLGKSSLAQFTAQSILCANTSESGYCGVCDSCHLFVAGTHPDYLSLRCEEGQANIKIDQVRDLIDQMSLTPQYNYKLALIDPADRMTLAAANSLLKTLEEPSSESYIVLVSASPARLPATVRSRCQQVKIEVPSSSQALDWLHTQSMDEPQLYLELASGVPPLALQMQRDGELERRLDLLESWLGLLDGKLNVIDLVDKYSKYDRNHLMKLLMHWSSQCLKLRMGCEVKKNNKEYQRLILLADRLENDRLFAFYEKLRHLQQIDSNSFKTQTVLEGIFADMRLSKFN